jgi:cation diffusion facilitator family transporter
MTQTADITAVRRVFHLTLGLNVAVASAKIVLGLATGALAITADGIHSLTDGAGNVAGLVALRYAQHPPDKDHPYGHNRFETVAALLIGVLLFVTAWEVLTSVLDRLGGEAPQVTPLALGVLLATLVVNLGVSRYQRLQAERLKSDLLLADARNTGADVYVTISVLFSTIIVSLSGWAWLDVAAALFVAALIARAAWAIVRQTGQVLVDTAPFPPEEITPHIIAIPEVSSVVRVRSRGTPDAAFVDVDVRVAPETTVRETEAITRRIRGILAERLGGIAEVEVHFAPHA